MQLSENLVNFALSLNSSGMSIYPYRLAVNRVGVDNYSTLFIRLGTGVVWEVGHIENIFFVCPFILSFITSIYSFSFSIRI